jgi:hypothetical protein
MTCDTYGHVVPGGNRQAIDPLDDGNRMETFWTREHVSVPQVIEKIGATRRSRTGDLLITNTIPAKILPTLAYSSEEKSSVRPVAFSCFRMQRTDYTRTQRHFACIQALTEPIIPCQIGSKASKASDLMQIPRLHGI